jgi:hypothetical protein
MAVAKIHPGQVWCKDGTEENWLVTKVYTEAFSSYAMLRKVGDENNHVQRLKIMKSADGMTLPGFRFSQESDAF